MNKSFYESLGLAIATDSIAKKGNLSYLSAATAMQLANRPAVDFVDFPVAGKVGESTPYLSMLGGSLVAVDLQAAGAGDNICQRMWLPVMDRDNQTLALGKTTSADINNSRQRCLVKAIAAVYGVGMSLFLGCDGDGQKAIKLLGLTPDSNLPDAKPIVATLKEGGEPYVEWGIGLAAARITDPSFHWEVVMWEREGGVALPYRSVLGGVQVDVDTVYLGKHQRLSLPVLDAAFNPLTEAQATVFDWNKTVMRALTKCIAFNSGYGLVVYADELGMSEKVTKRNPAAKQTEKAAAQGEGSAAKATTEPAVAETHTVAEPVVADTAVKSTTAAPVPEAVESKMETPVDDTKPETSKAPTAVKDPLAEAEVRFKEVMRKRYQSGGIDGLVTLFEAIEKSTKFTAEEKPRCYATLVGGIASLMKEDEPSDFATLADKLQEYNAMSYVAKDSVELLAAKYVRIFLAHALAAGDEVLAKMPQVLQDAGIVADMVDLVKLAELGNVPIETLDLLTAVA